MLQKFKVTTFAFILCLVGLAHILVSPVFTADSAAFVECQKINPHGKFKPMEQKKIALEALLDHYNLCWHRMHLRRIWNHPSIRRL